ncbi:MAG TPA: RNA polymerase sigma factor [Gammaproteobacteria bacterium]|nr:RNA polymerase sigma factor [Gammaproteobacteria bacterium]
MAKILAFTSKRAEQAHFERMMRPHLEQLYRVAYRFTGNAHDAEDLLQDLLIKVYPRREELKQVEKLRPWLVRVMYNLFIDNQRRHSRSPVHLAVDNYDNEEGQAPLEQVTACESTNPEAATSRDCDIDQLQSALDRLSDDHRLVISLHDIEGYTLEEMTEIVGCPIGTLKSRLHRARARLRALLEDA